MMEPTKTALGLVVAILTFSTMTVVESGGLGSVYVYVVLLLGLLVIGF